MPPQGPRHSPTVGSCIPYPRAARVGVRVQGSGSSVKESEFRVTDFGVRGSGFGVGAQLKAEGPSSDL